MLWGGGIWYKKSTIVIVILLLTLTICVVFSNKTLEKDFDLESLSIFVDGEEVFDMPKKGSGYTLSSESNCNNGVTVAWDDVSWSAKVNYTDFQNNNERTKCNLYFEKMTFAKSIIQCANNGGSTPECMKDYSKLESSLIYDETSDNNLRYTGANPNNYVSFNNELWRIIGVMENVDDGEGNKELRIKLIRNESIGDYSWDTSASDVNGGSGVNEWSEADLMKLLNPNHDTNQDFESNWASDPSSSILVNNSLYWNRKSGNCYQYFGGEVGGAACDFTSTGLMEESKKLIGEAIWHTGANDGVISTDKNILTSKFYELERSNNTGKICSGTYCNDNVTRTTKWTGVIGLMSPSDYGYATSGGSIANREICLNTVLFNWNNSGVTDCKTNNWLYKSSNSQWTISPSSNLDENTEVFHLYVMGDVSRERADHAFAVVPSFFLKSNVKITDGEGSQESPFVLELDEP